MTSNEVLQAAMRRHQAGDLQSAEKTYRQVLQNEPDHPLALQMLGVIAAQRGQDDAAIDMLRRSIEINPTYPGAYRHLGPLLAKRRQFEEAIAAFEKYLQLRPDVAEVHRDLGAALAASGRIDQAIASFSRAIQLKSDVAPWHNSLGEALAKRGRAPEALAAFRRAVQLNPDFAAAYVAMGNVLWQMGRLDETVAAYSTAIRLKPDFSLAYLNLGQAYRGAARNEDALLAFQQGLKIKPDDIDILPKMVAVLAEMNRFDEALAAHAKLAALMPNAAITCQVMGEILVARQDVPAAVEQFRRATEIEPKLESAWNLLGLALQSLGKFDEAAKCFRQILDSCQNPSIGIVYGNLLKTGKVSASAGEIERLSAALDDPNLPAFDKIGAGFALGQMLDDAGRYDEAFACYSQANSVVHQFQDVSGQRYDPAFVSRQIDDMIETFTAEVFQQRRDWGDPSELPVFIVGMPRTGTTLVHEIAARHSGVHGAGELYDIVQIGLRRGGTDAKSALFAWDRDAINDAARKHLQFLRSLNPAALRILDKMPSNVQRLELIAQLFPAARIIFCQRDARDTCLSCFFQRFTTGIPFSCDLTHCGHEYLATQRLMAHWKKVLPLRMLDVHYEELVADLEGQSRRLIDFLGLSWDPACLEFHRAQTTILTASSWQVRQPVYQSSVGRWRHYEKYLGPLMEVLFKQK